MDGEPQTAPVIDLEHIDALEELRLLREIRDNGRSSQVNVAISDTVAEPLQINDFPTEGSSRLVLPRIPTGGGIEVSKAKSVQLLEPNLNRYGGTIVNSGKNSVILILTEAARGLAPAVAQVWLIREGGSWDMRLGNMLWCGAVSAIVDPEAEGEKTVLRVVEV